MYRAVLTGQSWQANPAGGRMLACSFRFDQHGRFRDARFLLVAVVLLQCRDVDGWTMAAMDAAGEDGVDVLVQNRQSSKPRWPPSANADRRESCSQACFFYRYAADREPNMMGFPFGRAAGFAAADVPSIPPRSQGTRRCEDESRRSRLVLLEQEACIISMCVSAVCF
tara:strand:- start:20963 stop:21466 length:504 start_codon:yes stop_codon:yes gene_type:complete